MTPEQAKTASAEYSTYAQLMDVFSYIKKNGDSHINVGLGKMSLPYDYPMASAFIPKDLVERMLNHAIARQKDIIEKLPPVKENGNGHERSLCCS